LFKDSLTPELDRDIDMPIYIGRYGDFPDVSYRQNSADVYQQYLLIKVATLLFCMECSEIQVVSSSWID